MNKIRKGRFVTLIIILILICVVPTIVLVVGQAIGRPQETAELNKEVEQQEEQISAATTTVNAGDTYTVPKTGVYKIELRGGDSGGFDSVSGWVDGLYASKISGFIRLNQNDKIELDTSGLSYGLEGSTTDELTPSMGGPGYERVMKLNGSEVRMGSWCSRIERVRDYV